MTADTIRRRLDRLDAPTAPPGRMTVVHDGDVEKIYWSPHGRPPVLVKTLRGVSIEDL